MRCLRSRSTSPSSSTLRVLKEAISRPWLWLKEKKIIEIFVTICVHIYLNMFSLCWPPLSGWFGIVSAVAATLIPRKRGRKKEKSRQIYIPEHVKHKKGAGIAQWLEHRTRDWKVAGSNPCWNGRRILFSRVDFLCWLLFRYPFHPRVTAVARKKSRSFCQKVQVAGYS